MLSRFNIIVAIDNKNGLGKNGFIPWNNMEDFAHFRKTTIGNGNNVVIMGYRTYKSLPDNVRPLPKRRNIVIMSKDKEFNESTINQDITTCDSIVDALKLCVSYDKIYIIGGKKIYEECIYKYMYLCDKIFISHIPGNYDCDMFFPYVELDKFQIRKNIKFSTFNLEIITIQIIHPEQQYLNLLIKIMNEGEFRPDRTKIGTKSIFAPRMEFDLRDGFPLITTKRTWFNGILKELLFFISGKTDTKILEEQGVNIWKDNTNIKFLTENNLPWQEGDMGPCFIAGTQILTIDGYKNIQDINIGEKVYTHTGMWHKVEQTHVNKITGNLIVLNVWHHPSVINSTEEHPYYARYFEKSNEQGQISMESPEWIVAKSLTKNHMIGFKIDTKEIIPQILLKKYPKNKSFKDTFIKSISTPEEWFFLGFFLENGWLVNKNNIYINVNRKCKNSVVPIISKIINIQLYEIFDDYYIYKYIDRDDVWSQILIEFGESIYNKKIPNWVHLAPKNHIIKFLEGCSTLSCTNIRKYITISKDVAYSIQRLYLKLGYIASISLHNNANVLIDIYFIKVNIEEKLPQKNNYSCIENGYAWFTIRDIISHPVSDTLVYNLTVAHDNTYTVCNLNVHNCYGFQWRHAGAKYTGCDTNYMGKGVDQLQNLIESLRKDPYSRRHIISAWDVTNIPMMVLPPCHCFIQFYVGSDDNINDPVPFYLDCCLYQRSADMFLGVPFNIASYAILMCIIGKLTGLVPRKFIHDLGDTHIYLTHIEKINEQIKRTPYPFPKLTFTRDFKHIDDICFKDIKLENYISHPELRGDMAI